MSDQSNDQRDIDNLLREVKALRRDRNMVRAQGKALATFGELSTRVFLGPELSVSISQWLESKKRNQDYAPIETTSNLIAAVIRRVIRVGLIAITLALIPTALLLWQNLIMRDQYLALITQISEQRQQTEIQQITSYFPLLLSGDRTQFLAAASYFSSTESLTNEAISRLSRMLLEGEGEGACSALEALARISPLGHPSDGMRIHDVTSVLVPLIDYQEIPLGGIEVRDLQCAGLRLSQTSIAQLALRNSNLSNSEFSYVDMSGTSFHDSDLRGAFFLDGI